MLRRYSSSVASSSEPWNRAEGEALASSSRRLSSATSRLSCTNKKTFPFILTRNEWHLSRTAVILYRDLYKIMRFSRLRKPSIITGPNGSEHEMAPECAARNRQSQNGRRRLTGVGAGKCPARCVAWTAAGAADRPSARRWPTPFPTPSPPRPAPRRFDKFYDHSLNCPSHFLSSFINSIISIHQSLQRYQQ